MRVSELEKMSVQGFRSRIGKLEDGRGLVERRIAEACRVNAETREARDVEYGYAAIDSRRERIGDDRVPCQGAVLADLRLAPGEAKLVDQRGAEDARVA